MVAARRARGFTLPELLAGVAVMAILATVAAPSFSELIAGQRVKSAASDVFASLLRTRSEAIKRNTAITLSPADEGWASGWNIAHPTDGDILLDDHGAITGATIDGPSSVTYLPNGRLSGTTAPSFDIEVDGSSQRRCVEIDLSGRPYQKPTACVPAQ
ncbi:prepilin-type N-terminal cleavage/methylation domain-containing protein [Massilia sp. RP-1-19]|uniref:Type II secretion system protein H n=1 Tax=Massilia polaris TaxID=2728846 RepID=A0A848HG53_9BURK|nr:GspH/FimT family pseudopilin [Massilia polaris]NML60047.1 prepilin-type N-terminal cleavage/methylation domain-containing protein [Massilia polaris]